MPQLGLRTLYELSTARKADAGRAKIWLSGRDPKSITQAEARELAGRPVADRRVVRDPSDGAVTEVAARRSTPSAASIPPKPGPSARAPDTEPTGAATATFEVRYLGGLGTLVLDNVKAAKDQVRIRQGDGTIVSAPASRVRIVSVKPGRGEGGGQRRAFRRWSGPMSLVPIVRRLGGDLYDQGRRANVPDPGHSKHDRSVSLLLLEGRIVIHSFGRSTWREVRDELRRRGLVDDAGRPASSVGASSSNWTLASQPARFDRQGIALRLWDDATALTRQVSVLHLRRRGVGRAAPVSASLRHHGGVASAVYIARGHRRPALLAAVSAAAGDLCAVELTYLDPNGDRTRAVRISPKVIGALRPACAVRLDPAAPELHDAFGQRALLPSGLGASVDAQPSHLARPRGRAIGAHRRRSRGRWRTFGHLARGSPQGREDRRAPCAAACARERLERSRYDAEPHGE